MRFLLEWRDQSGDEHYAIHRVEESLIAASIAIHDLLLDETAWDDGAEEERPATDVFMDEFGNGRNYDAAMRTADYDPLVLECQNGTLTVRRLE